MISNSEKNPANRRQSQRCKARQSVLVECRKGAYGLGPNLSQMVLDISDSGVRLVVTQALSIADEVEIVITAYGVSKPIKRFGIIRWQVRLEAGNFCVGVEFQKRLVYRDWQNLISAN
jgi:c-di-GMP-binding flagellar brake protein YcgR